MRFPLEAQTNPFSTNLKSDYTTVKDYFIRSAEKMPDTAYTFKPSPDVRTFAQLVAHVADDQYNLCAPPKAKSVTLPTPRSSTP